MEATPLRFRRTRIVGIETDTSRYPINNTYRARALLIDSRFKQAHNGLLWPGCVGYGSVVSPPSQQRPAHALDRFAI